MVGATLDVEYILEMKHDGYTEVTSTPADLGAFGDGRMPDAIDIWIFQLCASE